MRWPILVILMMISSTPKRDPAHSRPPVRLRSLPGAVEEGHASVVRGRVQSVATRLVVDRERERMAFRSASYWDLDAILDAGADVEPPTFLPA